MPGGRERRRREEEEETNNKIKKQKAAKKKSRFANKKMKKSQKKDGNNTFQFQRVLFFKPHPPTPTPPHTRESAEKKHRESFKKKVFTEFAALYFFF